jgi:hypothetical protein
MSDMSSRVQHSPPLGPEEEAGGGSLGTAAAGRAKDRGRYAEYLVRRGEIRDLERGMESQRKRAHRHFLFAFLGLSPAAFFPMVGLLNAGGLALAVGLGVAVTFVELTQGLLARRRFFRILDVYEERKTRLREMGPF